MNSSRPQPKFKIGDIVRGTGSETFRKITERRYWTNDNWWVYTLDDGDKYSEPYLDLFNFRKIELDVEQDGDDIERLKDKNKELLKRIQLIEEFIRKQSEINEKFMKLNQAGIVKLKT